MIGHGSKFARKKEQAIAALLTQRTTEDAARSVGIGSATLLRWLRDPEFDAAYRQARRAAFGQSIARLQQGASAAASTLLKVMVDASSPASCRLRAADSVLGHGQGDRAGGHRSARGGARAGRRATKTRTSPVKAI